MDNVLAMGLTGDGSLLSLWELGQAAIGREAGYTLYRALFCASLKRFWINCWKLNYLKELSSPLSFAVDSAALRVEKGGVSYTECRTWPN